MKYPVHKSILFYSLCSNNSQPQSLTTTRFVDGVLEFKNVDGAFDIDANKHIIFFLTQFFYSTTNILYFLQLVIAHKQTIFITLIFFKKHRGGTK